MKTTSISIITWAPEFAGSRWDCPADDAAGWAFDDGPDCISAVAAPPWTLWDWTSRPSFLWADNDLCVERVTLFAEARVVWLCVCGMVWEAICKSCRIKTPASSVSRCKPLTHLSRRHSSILSFNLTQVSLLSDNLHSIRWTLRSHYTYNACVHHHVFIAMYIQSEPQRCDKNITLTMQGRG